MVVDRMMGARTWCLCALPVTLLVIGVPAPAYGVDPPPQQQDGDVVIALNAACREGGWVSCAPFMQAVIAWKSRSIISDASPGAVAADSAPSFTVGWDLKDNEGNPGVGVSNSVANWMERVPPVHAQVGLSWSSVTMASAQLAHHTQHVMVGYSATNALLSSKTEFGYFMRTCPPDSLQSAAFLALVDKFKADRLIFVYIDEPYAAGIYNYFRDHAPPTMQLQSEGMVNQPAAFDDSKWIPALLRTRARAERYILMAAAPGPAIEVWRLAHELDLWTVDRQWFGAEATIGSVKLQFETIVGAIGVRPAARGRLLPAWLDWTTSLTSSQFPQLLTDQPSAQVPLTDKTLQDKLVTFYDPFLVDATFAVLFAIERLHAAGVALADCRGAALKAELYKSSFEGASGLVVFDENGDRAASFEVWNIVPGVGADMVQVRGTWSAMGGLTIGGWKGSLESPDFAPLIFTNASEVPPALVVTGCPKGQRYLGFDAGCAPCSRGTYSPSDNNVKDTCLACEPGFHGPDEGLSVCKVCPTGMFQNATGQQSCAPCPAGEFAAVVSSSVCEVCGVGMFSKASATQCSHCALGTYALAQGSATCSKCPTGFTTEFLGSVVPAACACPVDTLFVPEPSGGVGSAGEPKGTCFRCVDPANKNIFADGMLCPGGRECEHVANRTVDASFPCPDIGSDCADPDGCRVRCLVPVAKAREVCESFQYQDLCQGWSLNSAALRHGDWIHPDSRLGWQNVALLGSIESVADPTTYGRVDPEFVLVPQRAFCSPVSQSDSAALLPSDPKHLIMSFPQPPLVRGGYYIPDLIAVQEAQLPSTRNPRAADGGAPTLDPVVLEGLRQAETKLRTRLPSPWSDTYFRLLPVDQNAPADQIPGPVPLFKCRSPLVCPGGHPGQCNPGQSGLNCARCVSGFYSSSTTGCERCGDGSLTSIVPITFLGMVYILLILLYKMTLNPLASQLSAKLTSGLAMGLTFNGLQTFGVMSLMSIDFQEPLLTLLTSLRLFLFDLDQLQWECLMSVSPMGKLSARILAPPIVCLMYLSLFVFTRLLHAGQPKEFAAWTVPHTFNCMGMVLQVLFISICMGVILPFKCAQHPVGGVATLSDVPYQVCGLGDHQSMAVVGTIFIFVYPVFGMASCTYVIYVLPGLTSRDPQYLNYFKFLVSRFRFDRYYFGVLFMLRNLSISLVPVLNPSNPMLQQVAMASILLIALCGQALLWPWAAKEVNYLDLTCLVCMIITVVLTAGMVDAKTVDTGALNVVAAATVALAFGMMFVVVADASLKVLGDMCYSRHRCSRIAERLRTKPRTARIEEIGGSLQGVVDLLRNWKRNNFNGFVASLPLYDQQALVKMISMVAGTIQTDSDTPTLSAPSRITVQRFKRMSSFGGTDAVVAALAGVMDVGAAVAALEGGDCACKDKTQIKCSMCSEGTGVLAAVEDEEMMDV